MKKETTESPKPEYPKGLVLVTKTSVYIIECDMIYGVNHPSSRTVVWQSAFNTESFFRSADIQLRPLKPTHQFIDSSIQRVTSESILAPPSKALIEKHTGEDKSLI